MTIPALFLMGPTASGKTSLALALADAVARGGTPWSGVDLISVDSAQIYRGMDIGTAKLPREVLSTYPHGLIDILDPAQSYSAAQFRHDALALVATARAAHRLPILVGGTGLYFRALENGLSDLPVADAALREQLGAQGAALGWPAMHAELARIDATAANQIKPNDPQRILRALEIHTLTGRTRSEHWAAPKSDGLAGPIVKVGLLPPDRAALHAAIAERFHAMMDAGFHDEVRALKARGDLHADLPSIRAVGYRQLWEHLSGACSLSVAIERGIIATRQYAKRQITWLRSEPSLVLIDPRMANAVQDTLLKLHSSAGGVGT
ncbi:MAG: tRNA (adenosine(37)-N6)-dimethylallyltransferase MiaA [Stagnimonas sp.]|nr:tRNA (adenosine(37)-N6)-dimethylallyltransferase MiaA [Stagnimonas sp.]